MKKNNKVTKAKTADNGLHSWSVLFCDDVRQEMNGKLSLMGSYASDMHVLKSNPTLPKLCAYVRVISEKKVTGRAKLSLDYGSQNFIMQDIKLGIGANVFVFEMIPFEIKEGGIANVKFAIDKNEPTTLYSMEIHCVEHLPTDLMKSVRKEIEITDDR